MKKSHKIIRKTASVIILSVCGAMPLSAKEVADTVKVQEAADTVRVHELEAVTVEAAAQTTSAAKSTYLPSKKQKNASTNPIMLLSRMQIPEINVDLLSNTVTDLTGNEVAIFIDGKMAQSQDLQGMRMSDVLRVEYLVNPSDPKFQQKPVVLNFIMKQYIYGGYTKLYETVNYMPWGKDNTNNLFLFSRMVVKKSTWNLWGGYADNYRTHTGKVSSENFTFNNRSVERTQTMDINKERKTGFSSGIEHYYADDNRGIRITQTLWLNYDLYSERYQEGRILFNTEDFLSGTYRRSTPSRSINPSYSGHFNFSLGRGWSMYTGLWFNYTHENSDNDYRVTGAEPIVNDVRSDSYSMDVIQNCYKYINERHSVGLQVSGTFNWKDFDYTGNSPLSLRMNDQTIKADVFYQLQLPKLNLTVSPGMNIFWRKSGDEFIRSAAPNVAAFIRYSPNQKNSLQLNTGYKSSLPWSGSLSSHLRQSNEILYTIGNPALKNIHSLFSNLQYVWFPSNRFTGSAFVNYTFRFDKVTAIYSPMKDGFALLQSKVNNGNSHFLDAGLNLTYKMLDGNLSFQVRPTVTHQRCTGIYTDSYTTAYVNMSANYYIGAFNVGVSYKSHQNYMTDDGTRCNINDRFSVYGGWGNSNWSLYLNFSNPFRHSWKEQRQSFSSPMYSYSTQSFSAYGHSMITFQCVYNFGYGKQVSHNNERRPDL